MHKTDQERFWAGEFGDYYIDRQAGDGLMASNVALFSKALSKTHNIKSVFEIGANVGLNLQAIRTLLPDAQFTGIEINRKAFEKLRKLEAINAVNESILDYDGTEKFDLVLTKSVMIHLNPDFLPEFYDFVLNQSRRPVVDCGIRETDTEAASRTSGDTKAGSAAFGVDSLMEKPLS